MQHALIVFSGGQDSTTCLYWALRQFDAVSAVTFDYGQRHSGEIAVAREIAGGLGLRHHVLDITLLNQLAPSALTRSDVAVDSAETAREELSNGALPNTFVPGRNLVFLAFAGILAGQIGAQHVVTGVCQADYSGYPDCRAPFISSMNETLNLAMDAHLKIHTPLMDLTKSEIWALADSLGVLDLVREKTLTCYNGVVGDGCGMCPACFLRRRGLEAYLERRDNDSNL